MLFFGTRFHIDAVGVLPNSLCVNTIVLAEDKLRLGCGRFGTARKEVSRISCALSADRRLNHFSSFNFIKHIKALYIIHNPIHKWKLFLVDIKSSIYIK